MLVITRLIPEARGTTCDQRLEDINGTKHSRILRVPFRLGPFLPPPRLLPAHTLCPILPARFAASRPPEGRARTSTRQYQW